LSEVGERLYSFVWDFYCDWYLELSKGTANVAVLVHILRRILKLLHPYCPFVTEELWATLKPSKAGMLMKEAWPAVKAERKDPEAFMQLQTVIDVMTAIRRMRSEQGIEVGKEVNVTIVSKKHGDLIKNHEADMKRMAKVGQVTISSKAEKSKNTVVAILTDVEVHLSLEGLIDVEAELKKLEKEKADLEKYLNGIERKLNDKTFVSKAPEKVVEMEKKKRDETKEKLAKIIERLGALS
jgi:valyl-tRNA synthetase